MLRLSLLLLITLLSACTSTSGYLLNFYADKQPTPDSFNICHGYSCRYKVKVELPKPVWLERQQIAQAIALLEQQSGELTGIKHDLAKSVKTKDTYGQQDCIDETVNTTTYLRMLQADNLLHWHQVSTPVRRGYFVDRRWPHNSATLKDLSNGQLYAVDSWPRANGEAPEIKPVSVWYSEGQH